MATETQLPPAIDTGLPWAFQAKAGPTGLRIPKTAIRNTAWVWTSKKPLTVDERGKVFLRFHLVRHDFSTAQDAKAALQELFEAADPEFGLTYGWDYVAVDGSTVWHLRAPCLLSRTNYRKLWTTFFGRPFRDVSQRLPMSSSARAEGPVAGI